MNELDQIYRGIQRGYIGISVKLKGSTAIKTDSFFAIGDLDAAAEKMLQISQQGDVYHSFHVLHAIPQKGRGKAEDFCAAGGVFLDVDLRQDSDLAHSANDELPPNIRNRAIGTACLTLGR